MRDFHFAPIGEIRSCFKEKFGIPRQQLLAPSSPATLKLSVPPESIRGIEGFSHLWVIFVFHHANARKTAVRAPRLGGTRKVGVLASRSPHRPNPIALSVVKIHALRPLAPGGPEVDVEGGDFLDGSPILDIKPYLPYADRIPNARSGWAGPPRVPALPVLFSEEASRFCKSKKGLRKLIREVLRQDPRPNSQKGRKASFAMRIFDFDLHWEIRDGKCMVLGMTPPRQAFHGEK